MQVSHVGCNENYKKYCLSQIKSITLSVVTSAVFFALYALKKNSNLKFKTWHFVVLKLVADRLLPNERIVPFRSSDFGSGSLFHKIFTCTFYALTFSGVVVRNFSEGLACKKIVLEPWSNAKIPCLSFLARKLLFKDRTLFVIIAIAATFSLVRVNRPAVLKQVKQRAEDQQ